MPVSRTFPTLSFAERDRRWEMTRAFLEEHDLSALVGLGSNGPFLLQSYLANDPGGIVLFPRSGAPIRLGGVWDGGAKFDNLRRGLPAWIEDSRLSMDPVSALGEALDALGIKGRRIGVLGISANFIPIGGTVSYPQGQRLMQALAANEVVDISVEYGLAMLPKSAEELALSRHAANACERAAETLVEVCKVGVLESDIYSAVVGTLSAEGCDISFFNMMMTVEPEAMGFMGGHQWFYPRRAPKPLENGDVVVTELFALYGGIDSQAQATVCIGEASPDHLLLADVSRRAYEAAVARIKPGATFTSVWQAMREVILDAGCWVASPLAHSLAPVILAGELHAGMLAADIEPSLKTPPFVPGFNDESFTLSEGMILAVEPCAALGHRKFQMGGAVLVTSDGAEELNAFPLRLHVAG